MATRVRRGVMVVAVACLAAGCGGSGRSAEDVREPDAELAAALGAVARTTIRGTVRFSAPDIPEPATVANTTDPKVCDPVQPLGDLLVDPRTRGVADVIVALDGVSPKLIPPVSPQRFVLANRGCQFVPRVAVLTVGSTIEAVNHDGVLHTTHLYGALERNLALPDASVRASAVATTPGMISVLCDVHGWMKGFLRVDTHPFHAVTDTGGTFVIENAPVGDYDLEIWHERLGSRTLPVQVRAEMPPLEVTYGGERDRER